MSDTATWLSEAHGHVDTAQMVLDEVGRGLAAVETAEAAADRAVPVLRKVLVIVALALIGYAVYTVVSRRRSAGPPQPEGAGQTDPPDLGQL